MPETIDQPAQSPLTLQPPQPKIVEPNPTLPPPIQNQPNSQNPEKPSKNTIKIIILVLIFSFLVASVGSIALAYNDYKLLTLPKAVSNIVDTIITATPLPKTSRIVLQNIELSMANLKSATVENTLEIQTKNTSTSLKGASIKINGPIEFTSDEKTKAQFNLSADVSLQGIKIEGKGQLKQIDDKIYLQITEVPSFLSLNSLKDQWFSIQLTNNTSGFAQFKKALSNFLQKTQQTAILEKENDDYKLTLKPQSQDVNGLIYDITNATSGEKTRLEKSDDQDRLKAITDKMKNITLTITASKKDYKIKTAVLTLESEASFPSTQSVNGQIVFTPATTNTIELTFKTVFNNYDEPVSVDAPNNSKDLKEYAKELQNSLKIQEASAQASREASKSANPKQTRNIFENISPVLGTSQINPLLINIENFIRFILPIN